MHVILGAQQTPLRSLMRDQRHLDIKEMILPLAAYVCEWKCIRDQFQPRIRVSMHPMRIHVSRGNSMKAPLAMALLPLAS